MLVGAHSFKHVIVLTLISSVFSISCSQPKQPASGSSSIPEASYCSPFTPSGTTVTFEGYAKYERRVFHATNGLGNVDATLYPIRRAEVRVFNGSSLVACSETDNDGYFNIDVPQTSATLTVQINSRAYNNYARVSVLNDPTNNVFYSITDSSAASANHNFGDIVAEATGSVLGGAFNIYDQIVRANDFLRDKTAGCGALCTTFTVAPKAYVYWKLGFNPGSYVGTSSGLSFYYPGLDELYILGGLNGDPNNTDTDHFDNTVIIHEYGHFLEDNFSKTNSPGGSHNGDSIVDPRLAWGEGWANFFGVIVNAYHTGDTRYRDTRGNISGTSYGYFFNYELDDAPASMDEPRAGASYSGEGTYREFAVARALWDSLDKNADVLSSGAAFDSNIENDESVEGNFFEFWAVLTNYFSLSSEHFRNFGRFMEIQDGLAGSTDLSSILAGEQINANSSTTADYALEVTAGGACSYTIDSDFTSSPGLGSEQFEENDFFHYYHSGGNLNLTLTRTAGTADLDLFLYVENYFYGDGDDIVAYSDGLTATENININLAGGHYMINVKNISGSASNTYTLSVGASQLCP